MLYGEYERDPGAFLDNLQKGDEGAFRVLFDEFYTALCLFAERFLGEREAAADVVQEAFLKYWDRHMDFDNYYKIKSFLYVVVRHDCLNLLRNKREDLPVTEDIAIDSDEFFHIKSWRKRHIVYFTGRLSICRHRCGT